MTRDANPLQSAAPAAPAASAAHPAARPATPFTLPARAPLLSRTGWAAFLQR